jgi:hypothetical protein
MAQIQSGDSSDILTIDPISKAARMTLYGSDGSALTSSENNFPSDVVGITSFGINDGTTLAVRSDRLGNLGTALHQALFSDSIEGAVVNPIRWTIIATTMAATQSSVQGILINSGSITTINTGYLLKSNRAFMKQQRQPLQQKIRTRANHVNNSIMEFGFGDAVTFNGANTTGAYWQYQSSGALVPVVTYNSIDITGTNARSFVNVSNYYTYDVIVDDDSAIFTIQDTSTGIIVNKQIIPLPVTGQKLFSSSQIYSICRLYNSASVPASAPQLILTDIYVSSLDSFYNLPAPHLLSLLHRGIVDHPQTGTQLAQWVNSAEPASATLSNTAAGYTTLGGKFQFAAVAGAVTDYALFGFQVPAPATLVVTGVKIDTWNTGAAVATTTTLLTWGIKSNLTAVSLATATGNAIALGAQALAIGTAIGGLANNTIDKKFHSPIICGPGRFIDIILRMPIATATASQVIAGMISFEGYFI